MGNSIGTIVQVADPEDDGVGGDVLCVGKTYACIAYKTYAVEN